MKEERHPYLTEEDIEDLLSPRCDFHASPAIMERVMEEIETSSAPPLAHRTWWRYAGVAAAISAIIVASVIVVNKTANHYEKPILAATLPTFEETEVSPKMTELHVGMETVKTEISEKKENTAKKNKIKNEKNVYIAKSTTKREIKPIEGALSTRSDLEENNSSKRLLSTDDYDDYTRMVQQAYIERIRGEIAETEAYVMEMRESMIEKL